MEPDDLSQILGDDVRERRVLFSRKRKHRYAGLHEQNLQVCDWRGPKAHQLWTAPRRHHLRSFVPVLRRGQQSDLLKLPKRQRSDFELNQVFVGACKKVQDTKLLLYL